MSHEMSHEHFILSVQHRASLDSVEDARVVCQSTLITLGECLTEGEKKYLASRLPVGIEEYLTDEAVPDIAVDYSLEDFYRRVGVRAGLHLREARRRTRTVVAVLEEVVNDSETNEDHVLLPDKLETLLYD